jgi:hypothetical protein
MDAYRNFVEFTELGSIGLTRGQIARIDNGKGMRLRVEAGSVWITEERSADDVCLKTGEAYRIDNPGKTLISTLRAPFALVSLEPVVPVRSTFVSRFWSLWESLYADRACPTSAAL